jgi:class 3 adenylate cyclase
LRFSSSISAWCDDGGVKIGAEAQLEQPSMERSGAALLEHAHATLTSGALVDAVRAMEEAYRAFVDAGDRLAAVRVATMLVRGHEAMGNWGAARGWEQRGWRLLDTLGPVVERGYHELAWVGCDVHDPQDLLGRSERALQVAAQFKDHQLELRAQADKGLALVSLGRVEEGSQLLDEVTAGIAAGELPDPTMRGLSYCALMSGCERTADRGRAEVLARAIEADPQVEQVQLAAIHFEIVLASMEALRGNWDRADARLSKVLARTTASGHRIASAARLAELRIQQGRYDEAAALLKGYEDEFEVAPAMAALFMVRGEHQKAAAVLRSFVRGLGSDCLRLAPALAQLVELELRRGDQPAAARTAQRLKQLASGCDSVEVRALAESVNARMAGLAGDHETAIHGLENALSLVVNRERPFLVAQMRLELGRAFQQAGERESALLEVEAAVSSFERLGVVPQLFAARALLAELEAAEVVAAPVSGAPATGRRLATVLFTDIVGSTEQLARMGDSAWKEILNQHDQIVERVVGEFKGRLVKHTGDGVCATFDGPNAGIQSALALRKALAEQGIHIRTGLHAGEIELRGAHVDGIAVHIAARVTAQAAVDEILVSNTVRDLVAGSAIAFIDRGEVELKGLPGTWRLWGLG